MSAWNPHGWWMIYRADGEPLDGEEGYWEWAGGGPTPDWDAVARGFDLFDDPVEITAMRLAVTDVEIRSFGFVGTAFDENQQSLFDDRGRP